MSKRVYIMYGAWLAVVIVAAWGALEWLRRIEQIGYRELVARMNSPHDAG